MGIWILGIQILLFLQFNNSNWLVSPGTNCSEDLNTGQLSTWYSRLLDLRAGFDPGVKKDVSVKSKTSAPVNVFQNFGYPGNFGGPTNYNQRWSQGSSRGYEFSIVINPLPSGPFNMKNKCGAMNWAVKIGSMNLSGINASPFRKLWDPWQFLRQTFRGTLKLS